MKPDELDPLHVLISCFSLSSLSSIAALLRSNKEVTFRQIAATSLYSGFLGLAIGLVWFNYFSPTNIFFLIGVSVLAGLGGTSLLDLVLAMLSRSGINITITPKNFDVGKGPPKAAEADAEDD